MTNVWMKTPSSSISGDSLLPVSLQCDEWLLQDSLGLRRRLDYTDYSYVPMKPLLSCCSSVRTITAIAGARNSESAT